MKVYSRPYLLIRKARIVSFVQNMPTYHVGVLLAYLWRVLFWDPYQMNRETFTKYLFESCLLGLYRLRIRSPIHSEQLNSVSPYQKCTHEQLVPLTEALRRYYPILIYRPTATLNHIVNHAPDSWFSLPHIEPTQWTKKQGARSETACYELLQGRIETSGGRL